MSYQHVYSHEMEDETNKAVPLWRSKSRFLTCFMGGFAAPAPSHFFSSIFVENKGFLFSHSLS